MSYDLVFWREGPTYAGDPESTYASMCEGRDVGGLVDLPIEATITALLTAFPSAVRSTSQVVWEAADQMAAFEMEWGTQWVIVCCHRLTNDQMNTLIDVGVNVAGCRLYDPQTGERFS